MILHNLKLCIEEHCVDLKLFCRHRKEFDEHTVKEMADLEAALMKSRLDCETLLKDIEKDKSVLGDNMEAKRAEVMAPTAPPLYPEIPQFSIRKLQSFLFSSCC